MPEPQDVQAAWWDGSWNPTIGCLPRGPGCKFCYAPRLIKPYAAGWGDEGLYSGVVDVVNGVPTFNGRLNTAPAGDRTWTWPLRWKGAEHPKLGDGAPSLIFLVTMGELLHEARPESVIDRVFVTIATSKHIGLVVTRASARAAQYFTALDAQTVRLWLPKFWLGFSAANQSEFDEHWQAMKPLAERGWLVFASCAPLIGQIILPTDFLALAKWVIVNGECGGPYVPDSRVRRMRAQWAFTIRDQCVAADIPLFMRGMGNKRPIPPDLQTREFPSLVKSLSG